MDRDGDDKASRKDEAGRRGEHGAPPMPAAAATRRGASYGDAAGKKEEAKGDQQEQMAKPGEGPMVEPTVRQNFADTALWAPQLVTAKDGTATVDVTMPENLTTWKAKVWSLGAGSRVGQGETEVVTTKKLIVRLEAPRFFVENDEVVLSAIVHNYLKTAKKVQVALEMDVKDGCRGGCRT